MILRYYTIARTEQEAVAFINNDVTPICLSTDKQVVINRLMAMPHAEAYNIYCLIVIAEKVT